MSRAVLILQPALTLAILSVNISNLAQAWALLVLWTLTFRKISLREGVLFLIANIIFVVSDIGAIRNGFFKFESPDLVSLPYWEFLMWGFYLLHTSRMFPLRQKNNFEWKTLILAILFSQSFALIPNQLHLLVVTSSILLILLFLYHSREDLIYCGYLMVLGIFFETLGVWGQLWSYPGRDLGQAFLQFVIMWGTVGLLFKRLLAYWVQNGKGPAA